MKYAIVDADKAEAAGINLAFHRVYDGKTVLNENELLMLGRARGMSNLEMAQELGAEEMLGRLATREVTRFWEDKKR